MQNTSRRIALAGLASGIGLGFAGLASAQGTGGTGRGGRRAQAAAAAAIAAAVASPTRTAADRERDPYRHPAATLEFWGLRPGMTVIEVGPGGGYWTDILATYLAANGGKLVCTFSDPERMSEQQKAGFDRFFARFADPRYRGVVVPGVFDPASSKPILEGGNADLAISSRNWHGFYLRNIKDYATRQMFAALKSGGRVGIEQHRGDPRRPNDPASGYIRQDTVFADMVGAGFRFVGASEINANPRDTKDHPFGVWTLPPVARTAPQGQPANPAFDRTRYDAIGESDRMTLLFAKP